MNSCTSLPRKLLEQYYQQDIQQLAHISVMMLRINIPPITRALLATLITLSVLNRTIAYGPHLTVFYGQEAQRYWGLPFLELMPQHSLWYPWVIVTATLVEYNVFLLLIAGATILYGGRYLERAWNSAEFGKFTLAVAAMSNVLTAAVWVLLMALGNERMTYAHSPQHPVEHG